MFNLSRYFSTLSFILIVMAAGVLGPLYRLLSVQQMTELAEHRNVAMSQVFETAPVGGPDDQGAYLNMVVQIETPLDPYALIRRCQRIEANALRQRIVRWGPRTLDVDLLFYDDVTIASEALTVPHPRIFERRFVLAPLSEVAPELCPAGWERRAAQRDLPAAR
jgi:2-amino-4-hydroxy-6-hydroxymethyldihydropteridine diphosphokinase